MFEYQGPRKADSFINFVKKGFKELEGETVPQPPTMVDEFTGLFMGAWKRAKKDFAKGDYVSPNILVLVFPVLFLGLLIAIFFIGSSDDVEPVKKSEAGSGESTSSSTTGNAEIKAKKSD